MAERAENEVAKIQTILTELDRTIRAEPDDPHQLELFGTYTEMEREQARRNRDFLVDRLRKIPANLAQEIETIRKRYADPEPRLFPLVAVTFLVPEGLEMSVRPKNTPSCSSSSRSQAHSSASWSLKRSFPKAL